MKKIATLIAGVSLIASTAMADIFVGLDYVNGDSMDVIYDTYNYGSVEKGGYTLRVGGGSTSDSTTEFYYSSLDYDTTELGMNVRPYFDIMDQAKFYIQGGVNYGTASSIEYLGLKVGAGASYLVTDQVELSLGYDYKLWGQINDDGMYSSSGGGIYFGVSYWFGSASGKNSRDTYSQPVSPSSQTPETSNGDIAY